MDWAIPWGSGQRWNAREACWEPWPSWKTRLKPSGGLSLPTACSSAFVTSFPVIDASQDREGVEQGAQRRPEADRRDRQLQQARLVEVQRGPRVVRPHSEPSAQGQSGPGLPVLFGTQGARRLQRPGHHASRHSGDVVPAYEQALEAHRRAGRKPQARMVARRVRPRLSDDRPRQGEGQAGLLPVLFGEEEAREADKARLALGPSARKEWGGEASVPPAYRRDFANIGLGGYAWRL